MEAYSCSRPKVHVETVTSELPDGRKVISRTSTSTQVCVQDRRAKK